MMYKGLRMPSGRTPRTLAEDKGTRADGFTGAAGLDPVVGVPTGTHGAGSRYVAVELPPPEARPAGRRNW